MQAFSRGKAKLFCEGPMRRVAGLSCARSFPFALVLLNASLILPHDRAKLRIVVVLAVGVIVKRALGMLFRHRTAP